MISPQIVTLWYDLMNLSGDDSVFYYQDFDRGTHIYRIFNYRLASYTQFQRPGGYECRGHMFMLSPEGELRGLVSLPMEKFHNLNECPTTMNLDLNQVDQIEVKADGSLISSYMEQGELRLKSKGSISSDQAMDSMSWIKDPAREELFAAVIAAEAAGYTVNMEWCSPDNRIVVSYERPQLFVLNARHKGTFKYMDSDELAARFGNYVQPLIKVDDPKAFVEGIAAQTGNIEGYVCKIGNLRFKVKTNQYVSLHHAKDDVNNPRRLFEAVVNEASDDIRSMFAGDPTVIALIDDMEKFVTRRYIGIHHVVHKFYNENKHLDRKEYAIKGQAEVEQLYFPLVMKMYLTGDCDIKQFMIAKFKSFGIHDTSV